MIRSGPFSLILILLAIIPCARANGRNDHSRPESEQRVLYDFNSGQQGWSASPDSSSCASEKVEDDNGRQALRIEGSNTGQGHRSDSSASGVGAYVKLPDSKSRWHPYTQLHLRVYIPPNAPSDIQSIVFIKDVELNYYQHFRETPLKPGQWTDLRIDISPNSTMWSYRDHYKPWDGYVRHNVQQLGVKFQTGQDYSGPFYVDEIRLIHDKNARPDKNSIYNLRSNSTEIERYSKFELSFNLGHTYSNPFNPDIVRVTGHFTQPDGNEITVPGFFYQAYQRRRSKGSERLVPQGRSHWKVRFAPRQTGRYEYHVTVEDNTTEETKTLRSDSGSFRCVEGNNSGFIRISEEDKFHFETDKGDFYYPVGHNIAAVHDARAKTLQVNIPASEGTYAYDRMLSRMGEAGENWGRIWMSPWSFGLEWTHAYNHHYRDRGRYNLQNAWKLDHVLRQAEKNDIRLLVLFTAHGEIGDYESDFKGHDAEQEQGHPYWTRYGGPAESPRELYTSEKARKLYLQKLRYIVARWSYSTAVMGWEILNEADLASFYKSKRFGQIGADFVASAARHIRRLDPADHLITSSVFRYRKPWSEPLLELDELDFNTGHIFDGDLETVLKEDIRYMQDKYDKIFLPTEAGLTPFAQDARMTELAIHRTLWSSFMIPSAGAAAPWWWVLIDRRDLYHHFHALSEYAKGIDRRNQNYQPKEGTIDDKEESDSERDLHISILGNDTEAYCWISNRDAFSSHAKWEAADKKKATLTIFDLEPGHYTVEAWDTSTGEIITTMSSQSEQTGNSDHETAVTFALPAFKRDIAVKVKPR